MSPAEEDDEPRELADAARGPQAPDFTPSGPRARGPQAPGPSARAAVLAVVIGLGAGLLVDAGEGSLGARLLPFVEPVGSVWLAALRLLVLPLTVTLLTAAVGRAGGNDAGRVGIASLLWFLVALAVAAVTTVLVSPVLLRLVPVSAAMMAESAAASGAAASAAAPVAPTLNDGLDLLVPTNLMRAVAQGDLFAVMLVTLLFALALRLMPRRISAPVVGAAETLGGWFLRLAGLLFRVLPVAVFALTFTASAQSGGEMVGGLVRYVVLLSALMLAATLVLYPVTVVLAGQSLRRFARALLPVQMLAFSSRSSVACLPAMVEAAGARLALPRSATDVTLPFAVASFKLNMAISANFQMFFLLHVYGLDPTPGAVALGVIAVTLQSFATPGLPSGAVWTTTPVYLGLGIPLEGVVLTNVVDTIPDLFKTVANVTGDVSIAAIVARRSRR